VNPERRTTAVKVFGVLAVVGIAWLFAGLTGVLASAVELVIYRFAGPRWAAAAALAALIVAALATVLEAPTASAALSFAVQRPVASEAGRIAGVLAFVAVVTAAVRERVPRSAAEAGAATGFVEPNRE